MSFLNTRSQALTAAATRLQHLGSSMAAQNAAAAAPTTGLVPAAADEVSALQAAQFNAYGSWYQQVSAQAAAIHQMLVNTLGSSGGSYGETESANQAATGSTSLSGLLNALSGSGTSGALSGATSPAQTLGLSSSAGATIGTPYNWAQNFAAASSDMWDLAQGQFIPQSGSGSTAAFGLTGDFGAPLPPVAPAAVGSVSSAAAAPVSVGVGQASSIGGMSVPPSWAAGEVAAVNSSPAALPTAGWAAAPHGGQVTTVPGGVPSAASAGRGGFGIGAPRYGVKPTVMPKPTVV
jgi:PPE-repeat protein